MLADMAGITLFKKKNVMSETIEAFTNGSV